MTEPTNAIVEKVAKKMAKNINENIKLYNEKGVDASKEARACDCKRVSPTGAIRRPNS